LPRTIESRRKLQKRENAADSSAAFAFSHSFANFLDEFRKGPKSGDGGVATTV